MTFARVDLEDLVFLVSSIPSGPCKLSTSSSSGFHELLGERLDGELLFMAVCQRLLLSGSGCGSLYLRPSAAGGSFCGAG